VSACSLRFFFFSPFVSVGLFVFDGRSFSLVCSVSGVVVPTALLHLFSPPPPPTHAHVRALPSSSSSFIPSIVVRRRPLSSSSFPFFFFGEISFCDFGITCRLGSCHVDMNTGDNLRRIVDDCGNETIVPARVAGGGCDSSGSGGETAGTTTTSMGHRGDASNVLSKETQILLRKNKYPFVCKRHFELQNDGNRGGGGGGMEQKSTSTDTPTLPRRERKLIDFRNKVYVAPLTTVGNLPYRRIMKRYGADITCGEMALADQLLLGRPSEWALLRRHPCEDVFGVQIAAGHADQFTRLAEILANEEEGFRVDFVDMNLGCPIDMVCDKGAGASLMLREKKLRGGLEGMLAVLDCPVTIKMRTGWNEAQPIAHELVPRIQSWGIAGIGAIMVR
jgi:hypothetical protein